MNYIELFRESVLKNPTACALSDCGGAREMSYAELDMLSGRAAGKLRRLGCESGDFVLVHMGRCREYLAAYLGVLKAGCCVVPVVPDYPRERIDFISRDCTAKYIITEDFFGDIADYAPISEPSDGKAPALLIYTSGSTGNPKGILHSAADMARASVRQKELFAGIVPVRYAASLLFSFVAHMTEYLTVFLLGGCSFIVPDEVRRDIRALESFYAEHEITIGIISPQMLRLFRNKAPSLRRVITGSERVSSSFSESYEIINVYGMSEVSHMSLFRIDRPYANTPIGKALRGVEMRICGEDGKALPQGEEGEIYICGDFDVSYFHDPELTEQKMLSLPDGRTAVRSGDIGYEDKNENVVYVDRKDWMVKINGQRVETSEPEALLTDMAEIEAAAVKAFSDSDGQTYLTAFLVPNGELTDAELRRRLSSRLPEYMLPRYFVRMEALPKNANGKLNRKALLPPSCDSFKAEYAAPKTEEEAAVCRAFEAVLQCGTVGTEDDFFSLGGDSIKVLRLLSLLGRSDLTPDTVTESRTPKAIAAFRGKELPVKHTEKPTEVCPLTASQTGIYLECMKEPTSVKYNISARCDLPEGTDGSRFIEAVKTVAEKHPAFCAVFDSVQGVPSMLYRKREITVEELTAESFEEAHRKLRRPFDLENGPLYRFALVHLPQGDTFLLEVHHLIFDGSSLHVFMHRIAAVYDGEPCPGEEVSFFTAAAEEALPKEPERVQYFRDYFMQRLDGIDCDSKPIPDRVIAEEADGAGFVAMPFGDKSTIAEVCSYAKENGISENAVVLGAFGYALAKLNGTSESFFSTGHHGRLTPRLASTVGMFVRTLPFVCRFREDMTPKELLTKAYEDYFTVKKNDCVSFPELAAQYGVSMDISFVFQSDLFRNIRMGNGILTTELTDEDSAVAEIEIMLIKTESGYQMTAHYQKASYTEEFIRSFLKLYGNVIRGMLTARTLRDISLTDAEDEARIAAFNRTEKPYDTEKTVVALFREQAKKTPDTLCLVYEDKRYTYREVDELTDRLARALRAEGFGRGSIAGVLIPRCEYMLLCSLGILKAGGAYLPLDPTYPPERLNLMVRDSDAVLLFTTPELSGIITEDFAGKRIMTAEIPLLPNREEALPEPKPDDLFVMLYTSGSTGTPKGVMFAHSNTMVTAAWERDFYQLGVGCNNTAYASYGFDANVFDTYATITSGATLHIISDEIRLDLPALQNYYNENNITHSTMTTQVGRQFALMEGTKTLRYLSVAGEKLTPPTPPKDFALYNLYGPTEGSILATGFRIDRLYRDVPIGKAIDNVKLYVVDPCGRLLPEGAAGELWISGAHVTPGYRNRPEKTAEAYGENPFCTDKGYERVYRTGDIVRLMSDGNIQFIGRRDGQVKVRGFRVELTEVEEIIRRFDGIRDATVAAFDDPAGGKFIAAYVVSDSPVDIDALHAFIRSEKPPYMVPAVTMQLDRIPLNQNQKVNKRALPRPERKAENVILPENETQKKIYEIVAEVIGHRQFGIDTNIFDAGLTSIGTLRLNVMLGGEFDTALRLNDLKTCDTVRKLETLLSASAQAQTHVLQADYPLTQTQRGIFVECSMQPDSVTYNMPLLLKLSDRVDTEKLMQAVKAALNAHPYAKAILFADASGDIRARRNDGAEPQVERIACDRLPDQDELVRPFSLLETPLYRAALYCTPQGNYLFTDFHHIISDGTSEAILLADIDRAYAGQSIAAESYTGFEAALDEEAARKSEKLAEAKAYYDGIFSGCEADCLPPKAPQSETVGAASLRRVCALREEAVKTYCEANKLTPNAFFNAVFGYTLSAFGNLDEAVFTTVYHGRNDSRLASSLTMLVKTLPVLVRREGEKKVKELIRDTQEQLLHSMANDIYSFAEISRAYGIKSDIIFVYQGDGFAFDRLCGEPAERIDILPTVAKAPITLNVYLNNGSYEFVADYRTDLFCAELIDSLLDALEAASESFLTCESVREVSLLSERSAARLEEINRTERPFENIPANRLFERRAAEHPERIAVISDGKKLTYAETNRLANRIAHRLIARGVKKDTIVGMVLDRSVEISVTELAILKAGGAFLAMLPSYPDDRIDFCLRDAESPIVLTTEAIRAEKPNLFAEDKPYRTLTVEELMREGSEENPDLAIAPDALAYCIYTSGSTGNPKGVMIEHHNLVNCAQPQDFTYALYHGSKSGKVGLALSAVSFDMSIFDNLLLLFNGKTVCIATEREIHDPLLLAKLLTENAVDTVSGTPSFFTNYIGIEAFRPALKHLKTIVVGAEAFPSALYHELKKLSPQIRILNGYGPTECTITCCSKELHGEKNITIGGPAANTEFYVLDRFGNILPPYACGELIICGELVGRGYVNLPEKTSASFFTLKGLPAYHSGDTVRLNKDGEVEFFGRMDNQVKLRGFRVELDEIENTICAFGGIKQSKVIVRNNGSEDYLVGFFTADSPIDLAALTNHLKAKLTYYMVPDALLQLDAMPLTPSGKVDKKALPEIRKERKKSGRRAAKKSLEQELCELFQEVLGTEEYFADDNFFELGGTSLSASKVTMQLMSKGIKVEYQDVFDYPTPEALAEFIEAQRKEKAAPAQEQASENRSEFSELLQYNTLSHAAEVRREPLGDVLLTGAVGFLGIHVLKELLDSETGHITCLIRKGDAPDPATRLEYMLMYYFGKLPDYKNRVSVLDMDITDDDLSEKLRPVSFDTLINCAACVKHYAANDIIERINVHGVENLIAAVREKNARMIQISTTSVPGVHTAETYKKQIRMHENELFVVDDMDNKYCISKYRAELKMLEAMQNGMRGKIIRVGNLMGRHSDGEFQINFNTNAFLNALRGFATIGKCPVSHATDPMSFSPIDMTARAIVLLAGTNDRFTAFHADSRFGFDEMQLIEAANACGVKIIPVDDEEYYADYYRMLGDEKVNSRLQGLVTNDRPDLHMVDTDNLFTANVLYRLGFSWPLPDIAYLGRAIESLITLDYFEPDEE